MPTTTSFWEHPIDKLEEALSLRKQIAALQGRLSKMFGFGDTTAPSKGTTGKGGRRTMSPAARERIAAAQRARWAKQKGTAPASGTAASTASPKRRKKGGMSPEARERIAAAQRARWAKLKGTSTTGAVQSKSAGTRKAGKRKVSAEARAKMAEAARKRWAAIKKGG